MLLSSSICSSEYGRLLFLPLNCFYLAVSWDSFSRFVDIIEIYQFLLGQIVRLFLIFVDLIYRFIPKWSKCKLGITCKLSKFSNERKWRFFQQSSTILQIFELWDWRIWTHSINMCYSACQIVAKYVRKNKKINLKKVKIKKWK